MRKTFAGVKDLSTWISEGSLDRCVMPAGFESHLNLGGPAENSILVQVQQKGILEYAPENLTVRVSAACSCRELRETLDTEGQWLPVMPDSSGTVGGWLAADLRGIYAGTFGTARDSILQVTWIDGEGRTLSAGAPVVKSVAGYDIPRLMVGSLGQLGFLTEVVLKVLPEPETLVTAKARFSPRTLEAISPLISKHQPAGVWRHQSQGHDELVLAVTGRSQVTQTAAKDFTNLGFEVTGHRDHLSQLASICSSTRSDYGWGGLLPGSLAQGVFNGAAFGGRALADLLRGHVWVAECSNTSGLAALQKQFQQEGGHLHVAGTTYTDWGWKPEGELKLLKGIRDAMNPSSTWVCGRWPGGI